MEAFLDTINSSNTLQADDETFKEAAVFFTAFIGYPIIFVVGFVGNLLCLIILNLQNMRTSTNVYLSALAISDLMKNINDFMYFPTVLLLRKEGSPKLYAIFYPFAFFLSQLFASCSAWLTVSVAFERLLMVVYPVCSRGLLSVNKARVVSILVCLFVLTFSIPSALRYRTICRSVANGSTLNGPSNITCVCGTSPTCTAFDVETTTLWKNEHFKAIYTTLQSCVRSIVPLFILIFLNVRIICSLHQTRASHRLASRNRITLMLIVVVCCFIAFAAPDAIMSLMGWGYHEAMSNFRRGVREITDMLLAMNSSVNVFLYFSFNRAFRTNLKLICCCTQSQMSPTTGMRSVTSIPKKNSRKEDIPLRRFNKCSQSKSQSMVRTNGSFNGSHGSTPS